MLRTGLGTGTGGHASVRSATNLVDGAFLVHFTNSLDAAQVELVIVGNRPDTQRFSFAFQVPPPSGSHWPCVARPPTQWRMHYAQMSSNRSRVRSRSQWNSAWGYGGL